MDIFTLNSDNELCIIQENAKNIVAETIVIPSVLNGIKVTKIADWAFYCNIEEVENDIDEHYKNAFRNVKKIIIEDGIEEIGEYAFDDCDNLIELALPRTLKSIEFAGICSRSLQKIVFPKTITSMEQVSFDFAHDLKLIEFAGIGNYDMSYFIGGDCFIENAKVVVLFGSNVFNCEQFWDCQNSVFYKMPDGSIKEITSANEYCCHNMDYGYNPKYNCHNYRVISKNEVNYKRQYICPECKQKELEELRCENRSQNILYRIQEKKIFEHRLSHDELMQFVFYKNENGELQQDESCRLVAYNILSNCLYDMVGKEKFFEGEWYCPLREEYYQKIQTIMPTLIPTIKNIFLNGEAKQYVKKFITNKDNIKCNISFQNDFAVITAKSKSAQKSTTAKIQPDNSLLDELYMVNNGKHCFVLKAINNDEDCTEAKFFYNSKYLGKGVTIQIVEITFAPDEHKYKHNKNQIYIDCDKNYDFDIYSCCGCENYENCLPKRFGM